MATVPDLSTRFKTDPSLTTNAISSASDMLSQYLPGLVSADVDGNGYIARALRSDGSFMFTPASGVMAKHARQIARPTNFHTYTMPVTGVDASVTTNTTIATLWSTELDFDYIRICLGQQSVGAVTASATIAATATANDGVNPLDELGVAVPFTRMLFNNAGSPNFLPWNQNTGATNTITMNTSALTQVWGLTYSDWMPIRSLPQTGGSAHPLLMIRVRLTGAPVAMDVAANSLTGITPQPLTFGKTWAWYKAVGDFVTTTAGYPSSGSSFGDRIAPLFIQTYSRKLGYQVFGCGDSNMAGTGSAGGFLSFARRACLRLNTKYPVIYSNFNMPGSAPTEFQANLENILDAVKPSAIVCFPYSYNGAVSVAAMEDAWARAMQLADRTVKLGGVPILVGYPPRTSVSAAGDAIRQTSLARLNAAGITGLRIVDPNPYVSDQLVPASWLPEMTDDGTHFNELAHSLVGNLLLDELTDAFGI